MGAFANSIAFFGPEGTFTEEALLSHDDFAGANLVPKETIIDVLQMVERGDADLGFVPIENAIEGSVRDTLDALVLDVGLLIQREVVLDIHLHLMASKQTPLADIKEIWSFPVALAQCKNFLAKEVPNATTVATYSTADAARLLSSGDHPNAAAIAPRLAADLYGLHLLSSDVEDYSGNQTRFVAVAKSGVPKPTGHDRTSIVCFQRADRPGSLHGILGEFAARNINLTKLESRPTKEGLGNYCFVIDLDGHLSDEVVADCLRVLHAELAGVKFLGSYPATGADAHIHRERANLAWEEADLWMSGLRAQIN